MSSELREAMVIGIEVILFSLLIVIVAFFGRYAQDAFYTKNMQEDASRAIENFSDIYEFTSGVEVDYDAIRDKNIKRATNGSYSGLTEANVFTMYQMALARSYTKTTLPEFYLTTGDDIVRFVGLFDTKYDVIVANLDNSNYNTVVFTDMESANRTNAFSNNNSGTVKLIKLSQMSTTLLNDNQNKDVTNYKIVHDYLGEELSSQFYCIAVYDSAYSTYDSIIFFKKK